MLLGFSCSSRSAAAAAAPPAVCAELPFSPSCYMCCAVLPLSQVVDADGTVLGVYRKTHIPDGPG